MVEEQVKIEGLSAHLEWNLTANERDSPSKFEKEVAEINEQNTFQFPFFGARGRRQKLN